MRYNSALVSSASGKLGGMVATRTRYGSSFRKRVKPVNPGTASQVTLRGYFKTVSSTWPTLSDTVRADWATYAANVQVPDKKLGGRTNITANAMYCRCMTPRLLAGLALVAAAPTTMDMPVMTEPVTTVTASGTNNLSVAFTNTDSWASSSNGAALVFMSRPQSPGRQFWKGPYIYVGKIAGASSPPTSPKVFTSAYTLTAGQVVFVRIEATDAEGRLTEPFRARAVAG